MFLWIQTQPQMCHLKNSCLSVFSVSDHWLFSEDCSVQRFCSSPDGVMVCGNADGREVYAVTHDIIPDKGWVMQFKVTSEAKMERRPQKHESF